MALSVEQVKHAIDKTAGNISQAAKALGVSRVTVYRKINDHPTLKQYLEDKQEELVDIAESAIRRGVVEGNMTAIIFTLKCQGKNRGWVERQEITGAEGGPVTFKVIEDE